MFKLVVLFCLVAASAADALYGYGLPLYGGAFIAPSNYRGPLSLAPGQPANILAADGRPLDTLDVNLDRSAHYTAKALDGGVHLLKKRSAQFLPVTRLVPTTPLLNAPLIAPAHVAPISSISYSHIAPYPYAANFW